MLTNFNKLKPYCNVLPVLRYVYALHLKSSVSLVIVYMGLCSYSHLHQQELAYL